jgi:GNAT superfamily N-acetyltransferase
VSPVSEVRIRPMHADDVPGAERLSALAYPDDRSPERRDAWVARTRRVVGTDPRGCWVAELGDDQVGFAVSSTRELMWLLSSFAVRPGLQGRGVGKALLAVAAEYGRGCLRAMVSSSEDPRATRTYRRAGFTLHPQMHLSGLVDRSAIPVVDHVREGSAGDRDLMDSIDRRARGAAHGPDHLALLDEFRLLVTDRPAGSGYAYVARNGSPVLVAATSMRTAGALTWEALASSAPDQPVTIGHVTAANEWALDVGMAARLDLGQSGYLGLRRMKPPAPYLHHGALL